MTPAEIVAACALIAAFSLGAFAAIRKTMRRELARAYGRGYMAGMGAATTHYLQSIQTLLAPKEAAAIGADDKTPTELYPGVLSIPPAKGKPS